MSFFRSGGLFSVLVANVRIPTFVSLLSTVHILSYFCPVSVSIVSHFCPLSHFCLVFVFQISVLSCSGLVFVLIGLKTVPLWSSFDPRVYEKRGGQILDKVRTELFFHFLPGHPAAGQKWDKSETLVLHLSSFCPHTLFILQLPLFLDTSRTKMRQEA